MNTFLACIAGIIGVVEGEQGEKRRPDVVPPFTFIKHFVGLVLSSPSKSDVFVFLWFLFGGSLQVILLST